MGCAASSKSTTDLCVSQFFFFFSTSLVSIKITPLNHLRISWFPNIYFKLSEYIFLLEKHFLNSKFPVAKNFYEIVKFRPFYVLFSLFVD